LNEIAISRGGTLGTFERKLDLRLNPYVFYVSTGFHF
jgi:hypothetical protein